MMRLMGIVPLGPKPRTSKPGAGHKIYPYLLRDLAIGRGFLYLVAIMDWHSRAVLAWRISNTMDVRFCVSALEEAIARFGKPEIFNTDQGSQFTSAEFTGTLNAAGIRISMDGKGRWMDNVFIERLWRSLKYEDLYIKYYADGIEARAGIADWISFYNIGAPIRRCATGRRWRSGVKRWSAHCRR
jgi:putative transposase